MRGAWGAVAALALGCVVSREPGALEPTRAHTYEAPAQDRCARYAAGSGPSANCEEAKFLAQTWVRRLATGDEVCLEGGFGDPPGAACLARAAVVDTGTNLLLLEVRQARPDSRWFHQEQSQFWFQEGALVDLYLNDHGY